MIDFPDNPSLNQVFTSPSGKKWKWNGVKWGGFGGAEPVLSLSAINTPTVNLDYNTDTKILSAGITNIDSFFTGINQSLGLRGWQKLPGGLIIQWGSELINANPITKSFPIAFPNQGYQIYVSQDNDPNQPLAGATIISNSQFSLRSMTGLITDGISWLAVGS